MVYHTNNCNWLLRTRNPYLFEIRKGVDIANPLLDTNKALWEIWRLLNNILNKSI